MADKQPPRRQKELAKTSRTQRALEFRALGFTVEEISSTMREEGFREVSVRTIGRLLASQQADEYREELQRNQLRDIAASSDELHRLEYRDRILARLTPRRIVQQIESTQKVEVEASREITDLLREFWAAAEQADKAETATHREESLPDEPSGMFN